MIDLDRLLTEAWRCGTKNGALWYWTPLHEIRAQADIEIARLQAVEKLAIELAGLVENDEGLCEWDGEEFDELQDKLTASCEAIRKLSKKSP